MLQDGLTPLLSASKRNNKKFVSLLLDGGADVNAMDKVGCSCRFCDYMHSCMIRLAFINVIKTTEMFL
jgi:ankyrin repeat protein